MRRPARLAAAAVAAMCGGGDGLGADWDGAPLVLRQHESVLLAQTPNGSVVFSFWANALANSAGELALTSGGGAPILLTAPALAIAPTIFVRNWQANDLKVSNLSRAATDILIEAYGPGMPGRPAKPLGCGAPIPVALGDSLLGPATGAPMSLEFRANSRRLSLFVLIGGPPDASGNNAYVFALNMPPTKGPPSGYAATVPGPTFTYRFNWATYLYVAYFGAGGVVTQSVVQNAATVTLRGC